MEADLVSLFQKIRDIPYRIQLSPTEADLSCTGKNGQLKGALENVGLEARWRVCAFKWSDIPLPKEVADVPHGDNCTHAYLEVLVAGEWKKVDATWDKPLRGILPVSDWDGKSDTTVAVPCLELYSLEESAKVIADEVAEAIAADLVVNGKFYEAFNNCLETERLAEREAINAILQSEKEITVRNVLRGDLRSLLKDTDG